MAFKKGQSGNPSGRPVVGLDLAQVCRIQSRGMAEMVADIAKDTGTPIQQRLKAIEMLWDRGYGKPNQPVTAFDGDRAPSEDLSDEQLDKRIADIERRLKGKAPSSPSSRIVN